LRVRYKTSSTYKEFKFTEGDHVKIIATSFLYASENKPERIYQGQLVAIERDGFWLKLTSVTVHPFSNEERQEGKTELLDDEEFFSFMDIEDVINITDEYPNRWDLGTRFVLDGPKF